MLAQTDINTVFVRGLLKNVHAEVRRAFPEIKNVVQAASVTGDRHCSFVEIEIPNRPRFYWEGRADSATHARCEAWLAFLDKHLPSALVGKE
jgi:hypothetical protein